MRKIRDLFSSPKKAVCFLICILLVIAVIGAGAVYASRAVAENSSIGEENAKKFACADAGVDPVSAQEVRVQFDYEQGQFVYEVEFVYDDTEYEYWIRAADGTVVKKNIEVRNRSDGEAVQNLPETTASEKEDSYIGVDKAKSIAVSHAGFPVSEVTFSKAKFENDDGYMVYEVEFYKDGKEYEYTIEASEGTILEYDSEWND